MNTYVKYAPNVYIAKCEQEYQKGDTIQVTTKYGKENECIVFNLMGKKDGCFFYSVVRADGFNTQEWAKRRAEKLQGAAVKCEQKSGQLWEASREGREFLALGEPIKVGHHSEKRHRALIERNHDRMHKAVEMEHKAESYESRIEYWSERAATINLSMPESLEYYEFKVEQATAKHKGLKDGTIERSHSMSLQYANKDLKEQQKNLELARRLWA